MPWKTQNQNAPTPTRQNKTNSAHTNVNTFDFMSNKQPSTSNNHRMSNQFNPQHTHKLNIGVKGAKTHYQ